MIFNRLKSAASFIFLCFTSVLSVFATRTGFDGYSESVSMDLPEGFYVTQSTSDGKSFMLSSEIQNVNAIIKIYDSNRFKSSKAAVDNSMKSFKLNYESENFLWNKKDSAVASFNGIIAGIKTQGLCMATLIPEDSSIILLMAWSEEAQFNSCFNYIASFFDGLYVDTSSFFSKGILTSYLDSESMEDISDATSNAEKTDLTVKIDGHEIKTQIFKNDIKFAQELIEREYTVLCLYQQSPLWKEAWQRYYRIIFRDSCSRLKKAAFDIYNELAPYCKDETDLAQKLLNWVQYFSYEREKTSSDFANLPSIIAGNGSDCDSRSMLLCVLLNAMNIDCVMFVSADFSHAIAGLQSPHPGFSFSVNGKDYLTGETTAKGISWGKIEEKMADQSRWIEVLLP